MEKKLLVDGVDVTIHYDQIPDQKRIEEACIKFMHQIEASRAKEKTPSTTQSARCQKERLIK